MSSAVESPGPSGAVASRGAVSEVSRFQLYALRVAYFILAAGLGTFMWPVVIHHTNELAATKGVQFALLAGLGATAVLGLRYPLQMLPLLLFELIWKTVYLVAFALPMWRAPQVTEAMAEDIKACLMVVVFLPLIPWRYVFRHYVFKRGERWK
jgi:hypothetical protein